MTALPLPRFRDALILAREEAIHILRLVMRTTTADDPDSTPLPTREARLAACAVLRLPIPDDEEADAPSDDPTPPPRSSGTSSSSPRTTTAPHVPTPAPAPAAPIDAADAIYPAPPPDERLPSSFSAAHAQKFIDPDAPLIAGATPRRSHTFKTNASSPHALLARAGAGPPTSRR